jgi:hypothetical protein
MILSGAGFYGAGVCACRGEIKLETGERRGAVRGWLTPQPLLWEPRPTLGELRAAWRDGGWNC